MENNGLFETDFCTCTEGNFCRICSSQKRVSKFKDHYICEECITYIKSRSFK